MIQLILITALFLPTNGFARPSSQSFLESEVKFKKLKQCYHQSQDGTNTSHFLPSIGSNKSRHLEYNALIIPSRVGKKIELVVIQQNSFKILKFSQKIISKDCLFGKKEKGSFYEMNHPHLLVHNIAPACQYKRNTPTCEKISKIKKKWFRLQITEQEDKNKVSFCTSPRNGKSTDPTAPGWIANKNQIRYKTENISHNKALQLVHKDLLKRLETFSPEACRGLSSDIDKKLNIPIESTPPKSIGPTSTI